MKNSAVSAVEEGQPYLSEGAGVGISFKVCCCSLKPEF